ncbi:uncharacterized protein F5891DRAFT_1151477 [Suillus fuscotomentosus]|uniref:DUF6533 domain-containing protein n=1 Tax=Suillus fuscotomentosus TaxID=1912939 RepID=A0AAD4DWQ6_9AGAM|nr:uncharacterized protein F5891DRAFT_1151477 [Suillus fuscotomentosus]KAG1895417.1 hypothetical protein F5891DRAFT_1151477 [Suillus fuscotomentosus]
MSTQAQTAYFASTRLVLTSFALIAYDHVITLDQETTFFWSGSWSASRTLYFSIRYLALIQACLSLYGMAGPVNTLSSAGTNLFFITGYVLSFMVLILCQCVVTLRVWHLFFRSCLIRWLAVTVFVICAAGTIIMGGVEFNAIKSALYAPPVDEILTQQPPFVFAMYLPSLVVHTVMLLLTMYRFRVSPKVLQQHGIIHRFVKEGIIIYTFAAGSLLYEVIGLSMTEPKEISVSFMTLIHLFLRIAVATIAVSVCRAMLSVRSLAATYHVDPAWLLNYAELSRVQWRTGANEGEIFVESSDMDAHPPFNSLDAPAGRTGGEGVV